MTLEGFSFRPLISVDGVPDYETLEVFDPQGDYFDTLHVDELHDMGLSCYHQYGLAYRVPFATAVESFGRIVFSPIGDPVEFSTMMETVASIC